MKRYVLGVMFAALAAAALADPLADANKLLEAKLYAQALKLYTELAATGNSEAQFHLGEMYWYGEGVPASDATAGTWFAKAAGAGHQGAAAALGVMKERVLRKADIEYYVNKYDGADLALDKFHCVDPVIPAVSTTNADIKAVSGSIASWMECYNGFVQNMSAMQPPGKAIPADVAKLMNETEWSEASARMDQAYGTVIAAAKGKADGIVAANAAWTDKTSEFVKQESARQKEQRAKFDQMERDRMRNMYESDMGRTRSTTTSLPGK
ncbi:sel1 repeat family protein [Pseudoduganella sp. UC29_71]|uniref:sel1 repeat family protein n=1 Tax=Pseudoduganella sp. UC29_71 TaxID=3350174 RepID=UPI00366D8E67